LPSFPIFSDNPFTGRQRPPPVALGQGQRPVSGGMWRSARELGLLLVLLALGALGAPTTIDKSVWDGRTINIGALDIDGKVESKLGATYKVREPLPPRRTTPSGTTRTPGGITASTISFFSVLLAVDTDQEALELPPLRPAIMPPGCIDTSLGGWFAGSGDCLRRIRNDLSNRPVFSPALPSLSPPRPCGRQVKLSTCPFDAALQDYLSISAGKTLKEKYGIDVKFNIVSLDFSECRPPLRPQTQPNAAPLSRSSLRERPGVPPIAIIRCRTPIPATVSVPLPTRAG